MRFLLILGGMGVASSTAFRTNQSIQDIQSFSALASNVTGPIYIASLIGLVAFIILYYVYRDRIVELALRW